MQKYIRTHAIESGARFGNAFIIPNHYDHSLESFRMLLDEAKKAFPDLQESDVQCRTVTKSSFCQGFPVLRFPCEPDERKDGWVNVDRLTGIVVD